MSQRPLMFNEDQYLMMYFIWRWKVATTSVLAARFWPGRSIKTAYNRLNQLKAKRYLDVQCDSRGRVHVWTLAKKGYDVASELFPDVASRGFPSENVIHDLYVQALHLGNYLNRNPLDVAMFTEQELRCYEKDRYPGWVPQTSFHRPDGYTLVSAYGCKRLIAFEVELNRKPGLIYNQICKLNTMHGFYRVIWLVPDMPLLDHIRKSMKDLDDSVCGHDFFTLDQFVKEGWNSKIVAGPDSGKTISEIMEDDPGNPRGNIPPSTYLDARKLPVGTPRSEILNIHRSW